MKVSVCIAVKNCSNFIKDSLFSILNQDFKEDWEILLGDDLSSDGTIDVVVDTLKYIGGKIPVRFYKSDRNIDVVLEGIALLMFLLVIMWL